MTEALTIRAAQPMGVAEWTTLREQATVLLASGFLPTSVKTPEQALAIAMLARELDVPMWAGFSTINVIAGKPTVSPQLMLALIERSGQAMTIEIDSQDGYAAVTMQRRGRAPHTERFSLEDAQKLGLLGKDNWKQQPKTMLKWRAVAACARVTFPDIVLGLYTADEMSSAVRAEEEEPAVWVESATVQDARTGELTYEAGPSLPAPAVPVTDHSGPCTDEQWRRYTQLVDQAAEAGIDTAPYLFEQEELSRARIIEMGTKLRAELERLATVAS